MDPSPSTKKDLSKMKLDQSREATSSQEKYVISKPTGFQLASGRYQDQLRQLYSERSIEIIDSVDGEESDTLALMTGEEVAQLKSKMPGLVIERNLLYKKAGHPILETFDSLSSFASGHTKTINIDVKSETGNPLPNVTVVLRTDISRNTGYKGKTNDDGNCQISVPPHLTNFEDLIFLPKNDYWSRIFSKPMINDSFQADLVSLPAVTGVCYDWGHLFADMQDGMGGGGGGVKIGIIDTGICQDHPALRPEGGINCVSGEDPAKWYEDDHGHGTHCAGIIAAIVAGSTGVKGYAPDIKLRSYRVFGTQALGAQTFDIIRAIQKAVDDGCDIISMSLTSPSAQNSLRAKTEFAYENGVLCIAATGNDSREVGFPAAFPSVIGVGAFGKLGVYPQDSIHKTAESHNFSIDKDYFIAEFSNYGDNVNFCAPGVAITSTVPGGYAAWDGTSMACPQISGIAALTLAAHPEILEAPRDAYRVEKLLHLLQANAAPLGFGAAYEGIGCLKIPPLIQTSN